MRNLILVFCFLLVLMACNSTEEKTRHEELPLPPVRDLKEIQRIGVLRALTVYSSTNYFIYRGQPMGYEYELLQRLADFLKLKLELIVVQDMSDLIEKLNTGEGDIIAAGLTITNERKRDLRFTEHLYLTKQMLVQRKPDNWRKMKRHQIDQKLIKDPIDLIGDTVFVRRNSSYYKRLQNLEGELGGNIHIVLADGDQPTEKLINMVVDGEIKYTIADKNLADINASYYSILDVKTPISFSQRIAWAVHKESTSLVDTINFWIRKMKKKNDYYAIYDKYYKQSRSFSKRMESDFYSEKTGKISPYDDVIKRHAQPINWDWRLISSLVYQESQFSPKTKSWAGAQGLMQLMPATAKEVGIKNINDPEDNIRGGIKYLWRIWNRWENIEDSIQRLKFTFASYNCGYSHVVDAQTLCKKFDCDPNVWDDNVENQVLNLTYPNYYRDKDVNYGYVRGREPVNYVFEIFERYELYKQVIPM